MKSKIGKRRIPLQWENSNPLVFRYVTYGDVRALAADGFVIIDEMKGQGLFEVTQSMGADFLKFLKEHPEIFPAAAFWQNSGARSGARRGQNAR